MTHARFVHLRVHSAYSLSEGAIRVKDLVSTCADQAMPAVAVTDTNNMFGSLELSLTARDKGVQPIMGTQLGVRREADPNQRSQIAPPPDQIVLLAQSEKGYENLMALISRAYLTSDPAEEAQVNTDDLAELNEDLICLTGGVKGRLGRLLSEEQLSAAREHLAFLKETYDGRLYMELQRHGLVEEDKIEPLFIELAYEYDIPLVATNECFFPNKEMYDAHDALICIAAGSYVVESDRRRLTPEHYFKTAEEMEALFADLPEAVNNTLVVAQRCHYMNDRRKPLLPEYNRLEGRSSAEALRDMAVEGLKIRLKEEVFPLVEGDVPEEETAKSYWERLDFELGIIEQMGFPGYFLIVADFIQWAKDHDIPVGPGRGSGAGSLVAWALTITDLDPLRYSLLFERFLNPERVSMPDFDIDFCQDRREEVIKYVQNEYGRDRVAQIITFGKLQARAVLRDVGRVLQMPYGQVDRICKLVPNNPANPTTLPEALEGEPLLRQERDEDPAVGRLIELAVQLEGLFRHASTHAAGVVIGDRPLHELVPLYLDPKSDMPVTQFNMKFVEQAGLVKFDFLGLKTLTVIARAKDLIDLRVDREEPLDIAKIPLDDPKTYEMLCRADATGVFQLESSGMRAVLRDLKPDRLEDLIAVVALYRPGPMENIPTYIRRKHGEEESQYLHPALEPVLVETFGIPIYQEQVMQMAQVLAGYTLGGADLLRRAMGKKIQSEMDQQRKIFCEGAKEHHGVEAPLANQIFDQINAFAGYGFNKSHAAAYALVAYQTAWLKANYQVEFLAASMTLDMHNTDKLAIFKAEVERQGIKMLPPDINKSYVSYSVELAEDGERMIRYALAAIKNVGESAVEAIVKEREENGPFKDIYDVVERVDAKAINKRLIENLTKSGAFDSLNENRRQVFDSIDILARHGANTQEEKNSNQVSLFGGDAGVETAKPALAKVPNWSQQEKLAREHEAIGFYLSDHPLNAYKDLCRKLGVVNWTDVQTGQVRFSKGIKLAGLVGAKRIMTTSRGSKMAFVSMSDATGSFEVTLFQEVLFASRELIESGAPLIVHVEVQKRGEGEDAELRLTAQGVTSLEDAAANAARGMRVFIMDDTPLSTLSAIFKEHGRPGRGRVELVLQHALPDREIEMELEQTLTIDGKFRQAVKAVPGIVDVQDL
ncbi:DNA polymerase III alpha subunit [Aestuariispira insulae]|uniref:DNA polymerase III subunit alpha n=2 Tax=Aestuariispira insulae TaxID=1461337 RepID=A0A3D9HUW5_9PROT|nr:DNA polymerase III alpha subunit [Aestuariispira insulae]